MGSECHAGNGEIGFACRKTGFSTRGSLAEAFVKVLGLGNEFPTPFLFDVFCFGRTRGALPTQKTFRTAKGRGTIGGRIFLKGLFFCIDLDRKSVV